MIIADNKKIRVYDDSLKDLKIGEVWYKFLTQPISYVKYDDNHVVVIPTT